MAQPVDIAHSLGKNTLAITWADGLRAEYPIGYLRGWCPCAQCQGHGTTVRFHEAAPGLTAQGIYETGAYAIAIRFSDGHDSGIFSWTWLRQLAPASEPVGWKQGVFRAGRFET